MIFSVNRKFFSNFAIITSNVMIKTHMNFLRLAAVLCTVLYIINICEPLSARAQKPARQEVRRRQKSYQH